MESKLIFIYNATSGKLNTYLDIAHKIISPSTYKCSLCDITHGVFKERSSWKAFRERTNLKMEFLHIDEFEQAYKSKFKHAYSYPIILTQKDLELQVFVTTEELNTLKTAEELMSLVKTRSETNSSL